MVCVAPPIGSVDSVSSTSASILPIFRHELIVLEKQLTNENGIAEEAEQDLHKFWEYPEAVAYSTKTLKHSEPEIKRLEDLIRDRWSLMRMLFTEEQRKDQVEVRTSELETLYEQVNIIKKRFGYYGLPNWLVVAKPKLMLNSQGQKKFKPVEQQIACQRAALKVLMSKDEMDSWQEKTRSAEKAVLLELTELKTTRPKWFKPDYLNTPYYLQYRRAKFEELELQLADQQARIF